jgi:hypothetical protein
LPKLNILAGSNAEWIYFKNLKIFNKIRILPLGRQNYANIMLKKEPSHLFFFFIFLNNFRKVMMRKLFLVIPMVCIMLLLSACSAAKSAENFFWKQSLSITENHIEKSAIPFADAWLEAIPAIQNGHSDKYDEFFSAVKEYEPELKISIAKLRELTPPTAQTAEWQQMKLREWELLYSALVMYMDCWDYDSKVLSGTIDALLAADEKLYESQDAGQKAGLLQVRALEKYFKN